MTIYFTGLDLYHVIPLLNDSSFPCSKTSGFVKVCSSWTNIFMRLDLLVFQKLGNEFSWFVKGEGFPLGESQVFTPDLQITQVCLAANTLVGFSNKRNTLYKIDFSFNYDSQLFSWDLKRVNQPDSSLKIKQIFTNDKSVYALDDHSGIFEIGESVNLKWRLNCVEIVKIACGFGHFVALSDTGALYSWGSGGRGELGHFEHDHVLVNCDEPKRIEFFDDLPCIVRDISCGGWHTLALTSDGDIYSWGWNESLQLGVGDRLSAVGGLPYPIDLGSLDDPVSKIACGARHSHAVLKSGKCFSWGFGKHGQLGVGDFDNKLQPVQIQKFSDKFEKIVKIECGRWCTFIYCE